VSQQRARIWVGIDAGEGRHWAAVVDETGATLWSRNEVRVDPECEPRVAVAEVGARRGSAVARARRRRSAGVSGAVTASRA